MSARALDMTYEEIVRAAVSLGVPRDVAEASASRAIADRVVAEIGRSALVVTSSTAVLPVRKDKQRVHVGADRFGVCKATIDRHLDTLYAAFELPPRTKKNSTVLGLRQSPAYRRYRDAIITAVAEANDQFAPGGSLGLPLPDQHYNLAAIYYVDKPGERADLFGLHDGLADALQNAKVVSNDWFFRTADGSRIVTGDENPRVEITISPIEI